MGKQSVQAKEVYLQAARTWKKLARAPSPESRPDLRSGEK